MVVTDKKVFLNNKNLKRDSGLELFRIITMLLIVAHHYVVNSGLMSAGGPIASSPTSGKSIFLLLFGAWGKTGINCFVLISGYFMCKSNITLKKFLKLVLEVEFYRIVICFIFVSTGYVSFSLVSFIKLLLPVTNVSDNFTGCYIAFFLCIPFINKLLHNISEKQHIYLITIACFIYVFLGTIPKFGVTMNYVSWFITLYFISSYIRLYPKKIFESTKLWGFVAVSSLIASAISVIACVWLGARIGRFMPYYFLTDSNKIMAVVTALSAFLFFKNLKLKSSFINTVAASCFGVLLIHANSDAMRNWLWKDLLNNVGMYNSQWLIMHAIVSVIVIYIVCTVIDFVRINLLENLFFTFADKHIKKIAECFKKAESKLCNKLNIREE